MVMCRSCTPYLWLGIAMGCFIMALIACIVTLISTRPKKGPREPWGM